MTYEILDMYKKKVGDAIRHFRKLKRMSQHQLAKCDEPSESIFSLRKVVRVENGNASLTVQELKWVLATLGVTLQEFYSYIEGHDTISFQNDFTEIWQLYYRNDFQEAIQQLESLKDKANCNTDNPEINQAILLCEGVIQKRMQNNFQESLDTLCKALRLTAPMSISENGEIKYGVIAERVCSLNEYRILNLIANIHDHLGKQDTAKKIYTAMVESLENKKIDSRIRIKFLPTTYYNLSDSLIDAMHYKDAFDVCEKSIEFCKLTGNLSLMPELLYNRAKALYYMDCKSEAEKGFKHSHATCLVHGNVELAEFIKNTVSEKFQIYL